MAEKQMLKAIIGVAPINVLFVTNQVRIPGQTDRWLSDKGLSWGKVGVEQFAEWQESDGVIGTVVVDTTEIKPSQREKVLGVLKELEQVKTAAILLNNEIDFPFDEFELAGLLESAWPEEIESRIEANLEYHKDPAERIEQTKKPEADLEQDRSYQLKMAGQVQQCFLPQRLPDNKRLRWGTVFQPADCVSGDIYDIARLDEQHIGFYIADVVGHSMPAALLTMFLKQVIRMRETIGNEYQIFEPLEVIRDLNRKMVKQHLRGCLFATCCYCLLNFDTLEVNYSRAGHPYPILIRKGCKPEQLESRGGLLGVFYNAGFEQKTIQLAAGDKLFLYSDGAQSSVSNCTEQGESVFTEQFNSIADLSVEQMMSEFDAMVKNQEVDATQVDDITAIGLEIL